MLIGLNTLVAVMNWAIERNMKYIEPRIHVISVIAVSCFPLYYVIWHFLFPQPYENFTLRLVGSIIFIPALFMKRWPEWLLKYKSFYWYAATLYTLPFFFIFMLLKNNGSDIWWSSTLVALFLMLLWLDWVNVIIQLSVGGIIAGLAYYLTTDAPQLMFPSLEHLPIFAFALVVGITTNVTSEILRLERLKAMLAITSNIAHEMRTPLLGIKSGAKGLRKHLPALVGGYEAARQAGLAVPDIRQAHLDAMVGVLTRIENEIDHSNVIIDMLLMNTRTRETYPISSDCSMMACVENALQRYPFTSEHERERVHWHRDIDFRFRGDELQMVHVLFNLMKNALFFIAKAGKGEIDIRLERGLHGNVLRFRDTGTGIPPEILPHVFTRFYSWSADGNNGEGTGVGLSFCSSVVEAFGATIKAESRLGEYTEFILTFPETEKNA